MTARFDPERVRGILDEIERREPFVQDPVGVDALRRAFSAISELFERLHSTSPTVFWFAMTSLVGLMLALVVHLVWSLRGVTVALTSPVPTNRMSAELQDLKSEARVAIQCENHRHAIELIWRSLCGRFGATEGDAPRRQLSRLQLNPEGMAQAERLLALREQASFSLRSVGAVESRLALKILAELEHTQ